MTQLQRDFYTLAEVAELLGYKLSTLRKYYYLGKNLPKITVFPTGRREVRKTDYQLYIDRL